MKVHVPMIIKTLSGGNILVALPDYPRPVVMSYLQFEREKIKYPEW